MEEMEVIRARIREDVETASSWIAHGRCEDYVAYRVLCARVEYGREVLEMIARLEAGDEDA